MQDTIRKHSTAQDALQEIRRQLRLFAFYDNRENISL